MKRFFNTSILFLGFYILILIVVFRNWFTFNPLTGGDWEFYFSETLREFPLMPSSWNIWFGLGFGVNLTFFMNINSYFMTTSSFLHNILGMHWIFIERALWFWPYLIFTSYFSFRLTKTLFPEIKNHFALISSAVYTLNTYSLMLVGGGQMGVALSYGLAPLVFSCLIELIGAIDTKKALVKSILFGLAFSFQLLLDIRIAYVTLLVLGLYVLWSIFLVKHIPLKNLPKFLFLALFLPALITFLLHLWWIFPFFFSSKDPLSSLGQVYVGSQSIKFFSFSSFSHAFSLLQPNWPENIFGKVSFLKYEFLILPLIAFSSLIFFKKQSKDVKLSVLFLVLVSMLAIFLSKGANEFFGEIYIWLFDNLPGFYMFRDPTKWYVIIALSYSVLIPFTFYYGQKVFMTKVKQPLSDYLKILIYLFFLVVGLFLISPSLTGQLKGTFMAKQIPSEYISYKDFILSDYSYGRAIWVPQKNRYSFYNSLHPNTDAKDFLKTSDPKEIVEILKDEKTIERLQNASIAYVILPSDPYGEIFLEDRKYSQSIRDYYERELDKIFINFPREDFSETRVYRLLSPRDLFTSGDADLSWSQVSMTNYRVVSDKPFKDVIFTSAYDPDWKALVDGKEVPSQRLGNDFNIFNFPQETYYAEIVYGPQVWVERGIVVSFLSMVACSVYLFKKRNIS